MSTSGAKYVREELEKVKNGSSKQLILVDLDMGAMANIPHNPEYQGVRESLVRINVAHNKIPEIPTTLCELPNLEYMNFTNNRITNLPSNLSTMPKLKHLYVGCNKIDELPRGFGAFPALEILDLSYNNLKGENSLSRNFEMLAKNLRALYLADNDFQKLPESICKLVNLETLSLRNNDLVELPDSIRYLTKLKELYIEGNRLEILPIGLGELHFDDVNESILKGKDNPWIKSLKDEFNLGQHHVMKLIRTDEYRREVQKIMNQSARTLPPIPNKSKKASRK